MTTTFNTLVACTGCATPVPWSSARPGDTCEACFKKAIRAKIAREDWARRKAAEGQKAIDNATYSPAPLNLSRTIKALAEYDALPEFDETEAWLIEEQRLGLAVGDAFGQDTADRNSLDTCRRCVRPNVWLRELCSKYGA